MFYGLGLIVLVLGIIGFILWVKFLNWRAAKGKPVDLDKLYENVVKSLIAICASVGFLTILDWLHKGCSQ